MTDERELGLFDGKDEPTVEWGWKAYSDGVSYKTGIHLQETVKANENFYVGKQWEGVVANGLPTPQFNFLKRTVGHTIASIVSDDVSITATPMEAAPNDDELIDPVRIINEEFNRVMKQVKFPRLQKIFVRDAAVRGDSCLYTWFDADAPAGKGQKGRIRTEVVKNTRVIFGNPNDNRVQTQPWIMMEKRDMLRAARKRAAENDSEDWTNILPDDSENDNAVDSVKHTDNKVTCVTLMWKDDDNGEVWACEFTHRCWIKKPYNTKLRLYPLTWLSWDYVDDCYHGQAMLTGLLPNQVFVNKIWAMSGLNMYRSAFGKYVYDKTKIAHIDNRVGSAIPVAGNVDGAIKAIDPPAIHPQVFQYITAAIDTTQESLGATEAALGEGKAYNTSAILSLQKASSTPHAVTQQNVYDQDEEQGRIWLEFMVVYYGKRTVDMPMTDEMRAMFEQASALAEAAGQPPMDLPDTVPVDFDFGSLRDHEMTIAVDAGASSFFSEIASLETLDHLLTNGKISTIQYLERIPDGNLAGRRKLIDELKEEARQQQEMMQMQMQQQIAAAGGGGQGDGTIAETQAREEQRSTGFKELGEALRRVERGAGWRQSQAQ
ncbi:MAG: hypothetical protein II493_05375 [Spirochaetales bacterium]|nr:hypothetical protein [Spirochaetales bacterium]